MGPVSLDPLPPQQGQVSRTFRPPSHRQVTTSFPNSWAIPFSLRMTNNSPRCPVNCCASTHFGENQLALGSSGISPLTTTHPLILQHQS
ncbi:hypothetical protein MIMGU_mgv1a017985mg, partial [Erythranthe guttata]